MRKGAPLGWPEAMDVLDRMVVLLCPHGLVEGVTRHTCGTVLDRPPCEHNMSEDHFVHMESQKCEEGGPLGWPEAMSVASVVSTRWWCSYARTRWLRE